MEVLRMTVVVPLAIPHMASATTGELEQNLRPFPQFSESSVNVKPVRSTSLSR